MKIIPNRTMRLDGKHVEQGKPAEVSQAAGELAIRHGWASVAKGKPVAEKPDSGDAAVATE
jgi:hypothetical protein